MAQAETKLSTRRGLIGTMLLAPVAASAAPSLAGPAQTTLPELPDGYIWVAVLEQPWNALISAAQGLHHS